MTGYELSRAWFNWAFENSNLINANHGMLFMWIIEKKNRLGGAEKFGLPSEEAMMAMGIKSKNTYGKVLQDLIAFGWVIMVQKSKNQWSANIIAISKTKLAQWTARGTALDTALVQQYIQHEDSTGDGSIYGSDTINKPITNNHKPTTINQEDSVLDEKFSSKKILGAPATGEELEDPEADEMIQKAAKAIAGFFNISEINHGNHFMKISNFVRHLHSQGKIAYLRKQLKGYMELKKDSPPRYRHKWYRYIGNPEQSYADGAWNETDWWLEWKETSGKSSDSSHAPTVTKTPYTSMIAEQLRAIEAEDQWYRENRPQA